MFVLCFMNCRNLWKFRQYNSTCPWIFISLSVQDQILQKAVLVQLKPNTLLSQFYLICFYKHCNIFRNPDFYLIFKKSYVFICVSSERQAKPNATLIRYLLEHLVMSISKEESSWRSKKLSWEQEGAHLQPACLCFTKILVIQHHEGNIPLIQPFGSHLVTRVFLVKIP